MLPGMDGTGELFEDFLQCYSGEVMVLRLPTQDDQSYASIAKIVSSELPDSDFILLVESFSGGLVEHLMNEPHLRGVIFVASFISGPNRLMLFLARIAPKNLLTYMPGSRAITNLLFLGADYGRSEYLKFVRVVRSIKSQCLNKRITAMLELKSPSVTEIDLPCVYIMPNQDRLISKRKFEEISRIFANNKLFRLDGPHFILQAKPKQCAELVASAVHHITRTFNGQS